MKKKIAAVSMSIAMALTTLCACNIGVKNGSALSTPNDVYGMGAVSTVKLLGGNMSARALQKLSAASVSARNAAAGADADVKAQAEKFNEYFTALDCFMSEEIVTTVSEANTDENYPYETKLTINSKDFNGDAVQNVMYFTETLVDSYEEDDEAESVYTLEGVMPIDGYDYRLVGLRAVESDRDEVENALMIRAYADNDDKSNYVEMVQETSVENGETETEYVYSVYSNGQCVEQTAVEFERERENGKEEVEYVLEFRSGAARGRYVVEREETDGEVIITVEYGIDGKLGAFGIREVKTADGVRYEYTFDDDSTEIF